MLLVSCCLCVLISCNWAVFIFKWLKRHYLTTVIITIVRELIVCRAWTNCCLKKTALSIACFRESFLKPHGAVLHLNIINFSTLTALLAVSVEGALHAALSETVGFGLTRKVLLPINKLCRRESVPAACRRLRCKCWWWKRSSPSSSKTHRLANRLVTLTVGRIVPSGDNKEVTLSKT